MTQIIWIVTYLKNPSDPSDRQRLVASLFGRYNLFFKTAWYSPIVEIIFPLCLRVPICRNILNASIGIRHICSLKCSINSLNQESSNFELDYIRTEGLGRTERPDKEVNENKYLNKISHPGPEIRSDQDPWSRYDLTKGPRSSGLNFDFLFIDQKSFILIETTNILYGHWNRPYVNEGIALNLNQIIPGLMTLNFVNELNLVISKFSSNFMVFRIWPNLIQTICKFIERKLFFCQ